MKKMMEMIVILLVVMAALSVVGSSSKFEAVAMSGGLVVGMMEVVMVVDVTLLEQEVVNILLDMLYIH